VLSSPDNMTKMIVNTCIFEHRPLIRSTMIIFLLSISITYQLLGRSDQSNSNTSIMVSAFSCRHTVQRKENPMSSSLHAVSLVTGRVISPIKHRTYTSKSREHNIIGNIPTRPLAPPFPDGLNKGRIVTLPPSEHYLIDKNQNSLLPPRDISVWLPPDYDLHPNMKFPVLYCHDGQNAIQDSSSWTGSSWRLAGALTRLSERKLLTRTTETNSPPIIVLIPSASDRVLFVPRRHLEYGDGVQIFSQAHADFVGLTLKPLIDAKFRTIRDKGGNSVMGTSLGGQASLYLCLRHPDVFGAAVCMSPAFQPGVLTSVVTLPESSFQDKTIYLDNGGDDDEVKVPLVDIWDHVTTEHWWNPGYWWLDCQLQPGIGMF